MHKSTNKKAHKIISMITVFTFLISYPLSVAMAGISPWANNPSDLRESVFEIIDSYSEDDILMIIKAALPPVLIHDEGLANAISSLLSKTLSSAPEPSQTDPCDEAVLLFTNGLTWLFLSYLVSQIISSGGTTCTNSICIGDNCICVVDDYNGPSPIVANANNIIRLTGTFMIILASMDYLQNCL